MTESQPTTITQMTAPNTTAERWQRRRPWEALALVFLLAQGGEWLTSSWFQFKDDNVVSWPILFLRPQSTPSFLDSLDWLSIGAAQLPALAALLLGFWIWLNHHWTKPAMRVYCAFGGLAVAMLFIRALVPQGTLVRWSWPRGSMPHWHLLSLLFVPILGFWFAHVADRLRRPARVLAGSYLLASGAAGLLRLLIVRLETIRVFNVLGWSDWFLEQVMIERLAALMGEALLGIWLLRGRGWKPWMQWIFAGAILTDAALHVRDYMTLSKTSEWELAENLAESVRAFILAVATLYLLQREKDLSSLPTMCANCGYNLTGNLSGVCPECGAACAPQPIAL